MKNATTISTITRAWKRKLLVLAAVTALCCITAIVFIGWWSDVSLISILVCSGLIAFLIFWFLYQVYPSDLHAIRLVDEQLPELHYSTQLLQAGPTIGLTELQRQKAETLLIKEKSRLVYPLPWSMVAFNLFVTVFSGILFISLKHVNTPPPEVEPLRLETVQPIAEASLRRDSLYLTDLRINVTPPAYTGLNSYISADVDLTVPEGSLVQLSGAFSLATDSWSLVLNGKENTYTTSTTSFQTSATFSTQTLYQLRAQADTLSYASPYHLIDIKKDQPPHINLADMPQFQRFEWYEPVEIKVDAVITDDYLLTDAYIVATITEGSGESIRFREQKIRFDQEISGGEVSVSSAWSAKDFQLGPGNEFYFHVEAVDNRPPSGQLTKSPTYFFAINDTSDVEFSLAGDLGVDIMPDYFKSQLQLIMDTEKLIKEKPNTPQKEFNFKSNELGYDQKQLRLRYGQFMGEEDESGIEVANTTEEESEPSTQNVNVLEEFGHDHDHENEAGEWQDRGTQHDHDHHDHDHDHDHDHGDEDLGAEPTTEDPLEAFMHNHDDAETATFFTVSLKAKLRAAMNEMWDAELYLRLFQPEESLPYQYKALKLLKEIKNHARIYVKRVGFEPIEIKEQETRLTKQPESFATASHVGAVTDELQFPALMKLMQAIELLPGSEAGIPTEIWQGAGAEVARQSLERPGAYLLELNALEKLSKQSEITERYVIECQLLKTRLIQQFYSDQRQPRIEANSSDALSNAFKQLLTDPSK